MKAFTSYLFAPFDYEGAPWLHSTNKVRSIGQVTEDLLVKPGEEYIVWFSFKEPRPEEIHFCFDLLPGKPDLGSAEAIAQALHLRPMLKQPEP